MIVDVFESRMDGHARRNPSSTADVRGSPRFCSSLMRSKIRIFASTAMPIVSTKPAMPDKLIVIADQFENAERERNVDNEREAAKKPNSR